MFYPEERGKILRIVGAVMIALTASIHLPCKRVPSAEACCSLAPAKFQGTKGFAGQSHKDGKLIHTLAYQNQVQNLASGGNAMFLPIPAKPGSMNEKNIIDTKTFPHFLDHMEEALARPLPRSFAQPKMLSEGASLAAPPIVFDYDIYTIVLAQNANDIPGALSKVPKEKRPNLNKEIFAAYSKWYPGWTFALCCFNNKDAKSAKPMFWWYEPSDPSTLFFPALDAHTGDVPKINESVYVGHALMFSSEKLSEKLGGKAVQYMDFSGKGMPPSLMSYLPMLVSGAHFNGYMPQGDFSVKIADLNKGNCLIQRVLPPGLNKPSLGDASLLLKQGEPPEPPMKTTTPKREIHFTSPQLGNIAPYRKAILFQISRQVPTSNLVLKLVIRKNGTVSSLEILQESADKKADLSSVKAIEKMNFPPLPDWYKGAELPLRIDLSSISELKKVN